MARELMLLRHGKSDWSQQVEDFKRPLKDRGKRGAQRMGVWLLQQRLQPDYVVSSPAERAIVTAQKTIKTMGGDAKTIQEDRRIYAANVDELLRVLADVPPESKRIMLVGHNPGLELLAEYLQGERIPLPSDGKLIPTSTLVMIEMPDDWSELKSGDGNLISIVRPSSMDKKFPFPDEHGTEMRDRPAYYYKQSSVIPYRIKDSKVEILVVMSSKRKHWVLPKGISEPALSLQDSAAKEALEEAGIEGEVAEEPVGTYTYDKWGAECTVKVYPMRVTRELPESEWEENHRGREWLSPKLAMRRVKQAELKPMIQVLAKQLKG
ncbi:histidine phosphatase family protein [Candidatus Thiodiazotropha sp. CDECU1]|uniref:histidine phosphatase family protein n=1 Tax=Candidatus Thiodiazotropha sp. CDECU1 TaxID=3065865 RepID=UPI00292E2F60|nr:histidine phosphatase family protein [Candidatus Thiodiazotropha sp. CDECU1]